MKMNTGEKKDMRINRFLAACGLGSRRYCESLIHQGLVTINGRVCTNLATRIAATDEVKLKGKPVYLEPPKTIILNKPRGIISTKSDEHNRDTIYSLLPDSFTSLAHVGRLDMESEGLIVMTNSGILAHWLSHPRYKIEKEYLVDLTQNFPISLISRLTRGFIIEGGYARAESVQLLSERTLRMVLKQGLKRQIRYMMHHLGFEVEKLQRVRIGSLTIDGLEPGQWRELNDDEIQSLLPFRALNSRLNNLQPSILPSLGMK